VLQPTSSDAEWLGKDIEYMGPTGEARRACPWDKVKGNALLLLLWGFNPLRNRRGAEGKSVKKQALFERSEFACFRIFPSTAANPEGAVSLGCLFFGDFLLCTQRK